MAESDCKSCHLINAKSAGPSYQDIAKKYKSNTQAIELLSSKILNGGSGVWGETPMAAHPQISKEDASTMVDYILSLANEPENKSLALNGVTKFGAAPQEGINPLSAYIISATYDDNGFGIAPSLPGSAVKVLKAPVLTGSDAKDISEGISFYDAPDGTKILMNISHNTSATFKNVDLDGVKSMDFVAVEVALMTEGGQLEVYLDSKSGKKLGSIDFTKAPKIEVQTGVNMRPGRLTFNALSGKHNIILVFVNPEVDEDVALYFFSRLILGN
jgi:cytochrome c